MSKALTYEKVSDLAVTIITTFGKGLESYKPIYPKIAPTIRSNGTSNTYPLAKLPNIREWIGERIVKQIKEEKYNLVNKKYEASLQIERTDIEDDNTGFYVAQANSLGVEAKGYPDILLADAITKGFDTGLAYDGKKFFGTHGSGKTEFTNVQTGSSEPWILVDSTKAFGAFFLQLRKDFTMEKPADLNYQSFMNDTYYFGVRGRCAVGYGLPQLAFASQATLNESNFEKAMQSMLKVKKEAVDDDGEPISIGAFPTQIIVGPDNYAAALKLFDNAIGRNGASNTYYKKVEVVLLRYLSTPVVTDPPAGE